MKAFEPTYEAVKRRIAQARANVNEILGLRNERVASFARQCAEKLTRVETECDTPPPVAIALVGGTGAGKSTLLNALLDARILPVSTMRVCTAAISEVSYAAGSRYVARIEFISRDDWKKEVAFLLADVKDADQRPGNGTPEDGEEAVQISRVARDKLRAIYCATEKDVLDPQRLQEVPEAKDALDRGVTELASDDLDKFRKDVAVYLDSKHRFWPIVKTVRIRGPFEALANGVTLVDLPGINDPNEAREAVTRRYLKESRFVWMVFNLKRPPTQDVTKLMKTDDFLRQIVMDGRSGALTFVGTASDDIDLETAVEEFELGDGATPEDAVIARNVCARDEVGKVLEDLAEHVDMVATVDGERRRELVKALRNSAIFTVSAMEYMRLRGLTHRQTVVLNDLESTEVPGLRGHLTKISADFGVEARSRAYHHQVSLVLQELRDTLQAELGLLNAKAQVTREKRKEVQRATSDARRFLDLKLTGAKDAYAQELRSARELLAEKLKNAIERGKYELGHVTGRWAMMHWATLRATVRRGGHYVGSTGRHDLPADLAKPVLDNVALAWADFFGSSLRQGIEMAGVKLLRVADEHSRQLLGAVVLLEDAGGEYSKRLKALVETTEKVLGELVKQTEEEAQTRIEREQRTLYEQIPAQIGANMREAFDAAADEAGTGMKARMIEKLTAHAHRVSGVMYEDAQQAICGGVRSLSDWMERKFGDMTDHVSRQARVAEENITLDASGMTEEELEKQRDTTGRACAFAEAACAADGALKKERFSD